MVVCNQNSCNVMYEGMRVCICVCMRHTYVQLKFSFYLISANAVGLCVNSVNKSVSTFPIVVIFFRGCVPEMAVLPYSVIYYIYISGTPGPCFNYWCSVYGICKWSDTLWPAGRVRLFADNTILLSSLCWLVWRHWTNKMLVMYIYAAECVKFQYRIFWTTVK